jgi:NAD(P)-dependent dehydrogenase (short-subunit alcohol dehydrogenase family)
VSLKTRWKLASGTRVLLDPVLNIAGALTGAEFGNPKAGGTVLANGSSSTRLRFAVDWITSWRILMPRVWLVTGSASGLGRNIAEAVLASGDRLVATARDPSRLEDLVEKHGDQTRTARLDVADEDAAHAAVQVAVNSFGRLDVVVNNAGYGDIAPFEQVSSERFKALVDTNFYGVVNMTRAALPIMRKQGSGCILQISSVGGRLALPGIGLQSEGTSKTRRTQRQL